MHILKLKVYLVYKFYQYFLIYFDFRIFQFNSTIIVIYLNTMTNKNLFYANNKCRRYILNLNAPTYIRFYLFIFKLYEQ